MYWVYNLPNWLFQHPAGGRFVGFGGKISVSPEPLRVYRQMVNPRPCTGQMQ